jgi:hypothetical protein
LNFGAHQSQFERTSSAAVTSGPTFNNQGISITPGGDDRIRLRSANPLIFDQWSFTKLDRRDDLGGFADVFQVTLFLAGGGTLRQKLTLINSDFGGSGLNYTTYGLWEVIEFQSFSTTPIEQRVTAFSFGFPTPISAMPLTGTAVYSGSTHGRFSSLLSNDPNETVVNGSFQLAADFATATMSGTFTNMKVGFTDFRDINATTSITNNSFAGTVTTAPATPGQTGPDMSGAIQGGYYGPSAQEVSGVFEMSGSGAVMTAGFAGAK